VENWQLWVIRVVILGENLNQINELLKKAKKLFKIQFFLNFCGT